MARKPPDGKLDASGSPLISILPENLEIGSPWLSGSIKASCFSAVPPVKGWNQCVKCVAPFSMAHLFIACAIASAVVRSSDSSLATVFFHASYTGFGSLSFISFSPNTSMPKSSNGFSIFLFFSLATDILYFFSVSVNQKRKFL